MPSARLVPYPVGAGAICATCRVVLDGEDVRVTLDVRPDRWRLPERDLESTVRCTVAWHLFLLQRHAASSTVDLDAPCDAVEVLVDGTGQIERWHVSRPADGPSLRTFAQLAARRLVHPR